MSMPSAASLCCAVSTALLALVMNAVPGRAACNPTTDPDKTDIAHARAAVAANCDCTGASTRSAYVRCAVQQANAVLANKRCAASVKRCASRSVCGKPNAVTCCLTTAVGTTCKIEKDAARCAAKHGSAGSCTSCCDACPAPGGGPSCPAPTTTTSSVTTTTVPVSNSDWAGVYGAWSLDEGNEDAEMAQLESLGINLVIANVGLDETNLDPNFPGWTQYYDSAIAHHINLIPILWDGSKNQTVWNWTGSEFKIDPAKYPTDPGAHFFAWLHQDPSGSATHLQSTASRSPSTRRTGRRSAPCSRTRPSGGRSMRSSLTSSSMVSPSPRWTAARTAARIMPASGSTASPCAVGTRRTRLSMWSRARKGWTSPPNSALQARPR